MLKYSVIGISLRSVLVVLVTGTSTATLNFISRIASISLLELLLFWLSLCFFDNLSILLYLFHLIGKSDAFLFYHNLLLALLVLIALVDIHASIRITQVPSLVLVTLLLFVSKVQVLFSLLVEYLAIWLILEVLLAHRLVVVAHLRVLLS